MTLQWVGSLFEEKRRAVFNLHLNPTLRGFRGGHKSCRRAVEAN